MSSEIGNTSRPEAWWRGAVIYQIYPRSFQDSDGDGIGDLPGITARLDHVAALGANAIWISPFFTSPMADFGYDVSDYCDVDPMFGTLADFDRLLARAHALGIKVMIDLVLSHTSDQHPWFKESRGSRTNAKADWYVWAEAKPDGTPPNNWLSIFGGSAWEWDTRRQQYYLHNFLRSQPDLNFHCEAVQEAVLAATRFWLERGVDGFRLDTINFYFHDRRLRDNPPNPRRDHPEVPLSNPYAWQDHRYDKTQPENLEFLRRFRALLDEYGEIAAVGEVADGERSLTTIGAYTAGHERLHFCYAFDFLSREFGAAHVRDVLERFARAAPDGWGCWSFSNHDVERHVSRWHRFMPRPTMARFAIALLTAMRGAICIYQGEELALTEADVPYELLQDPYGRTFWPEFKGRDGCRTPMVWDPEAPHGGFSTAERTWLPVPTAHLVELVEARQPEPDSILAVYKTFIGMRRRFRALRDGSMTFLTTHGELLAFERRSGDEALLCVFNFGRSPSRWTLPAGTTGAIVEGSAIGVSLHGNEIELQGGGAVYLHAS